MEQVGQAVDFKEADDLLNFTYVVDCGGQLSGLPEEGYDLVISSDVGEHLPRGVLDKIVHRSFKVLRPGGWAYHQIVLTDHLGIYAKGIHAKEYLRFSRATYEMRYGNEIQHINLVQIPEWRELFVKTGFEIVAMERIGTCDLSTISVHDDWRWIPIDDLSCTVVQFLLRRPASA